MIVQPDVLHVMVAVIAAVATEVAVQDATHHAMHLLIVSQHEPSLVFLIEGSNMRERSIVLQIMITI